VRTTNSKGRTKSIEVRKKVQKEGREKEKRKEERRGRGRESRRGGGKQGRGPFQGVEDPREERLHQSQPREGNCPKKKTLDSE